MQEKRVISIVHPNNDGTIGTTTCCAVDLDTMVQIGVHTLIILNHQIMFRSKPLYHTKRR